MDDEEREALEMTKDELLARAAKGVPVEGARSKPKTRNREDFAQRMHRVVGETIARSEREEAIEIVFVPNRFHVDASTLTQPPPRTEQTEPERPETPGFRSVPVH